MKKYAKPMVLVNAELSEGIYMASGAATGSECYTVNVNIHQRPQSGSGEYRMQVDAVHAADHHSTAQTLTVNFNLPVTYVGSNGTLLGGDNTTTLQIGYVYHNNFNENIGLGDLIVNADAGLAIIGASVTCNMTCSQHDGLN